MSGSFGYSKSVSSSDDRVWGDQSPYLADMYARASTLSNEQPAQNANQLTAQNMALDYADTINGGVVQPAQNALNFALGAADVNQNPYLGQMAEAAARPLTQNLTENILPAIRSGATGAGQYGSSRQGIAEGIAARGTQQAIGDQVASLYSNAYGQGLQAQGQALGQAGAVANLGMMPSSIYQGVGQQQQDADWQQLQRLQSILGGPVKLNSSDSKAYTHSGSGGM